jgi:hypothetical protein
MVLDGFKNLSNSGGPRVPVSRHLLGAPSALERIIVCGANVPDCLNERFGRLHVKEVAQCPLV